jgi:ribosomal protein L27
MGRPLRKDVRGTDVINTPATTATGITCEFYDGATNQTDGIIIKQRGSKTYVVAQIGTPATLFTCTLVTGTPAAAGEMRIRGSTSGNLDLDLVSIAKLTKRVATNFSGTRYTWYLESDSSADYIVLTAI